MISMIDLGWTAGFLEGEGSFTLSGRDGRKWHPSVVAGQVQREPLERLQRLFGGKIYDYAAKPRKNFKTTQPFSRWYVCGQKAADLMKLLLPLMSPRRTMQIMRCIEAYEAPRVYKPGYNKGKPLCKRGHPLSGTNLYLAPKTGKRQCRTCEKRRQGTPAGAVANAAKTHCTHGHELSGANLKMRRGARGCITCERNCRKRSYWKKRGTTWSPDGQTPEARLH